jgi:hypothetical protein
VSCRTARPRPRPLIPRHESLQPLHSRDLLHRVCALELVDRKPLSMESGHTYPMMLRNMPAPRHEAAMVGFQQFEGDLPDFHPFGLPVPQPGPERRQVGVAGSGRKSVRELSCTWGSGSLAAFTAAMRPMAASACTHRVQRSTSPRHARSAGSSAGCAAIPRKPRPLRVARSRPSVSSRELAESRSFGLRRV